MQTTKQRKLNMEEKRKLEKMLAEDIDTSERHFSQQTSEKRQALIKRLNANVPTEARVILASYLKSKQATDDAESKLEAIGWEIKGYHDDEKQLEVNTYGAVLPKALAEFDDKAGATKSKLAALKRSYTLRLFAEGEEAQTLFVALTNEISQLTA